MKQINLYKVGLNQDCITLIHSLTTWQKKEWNSVANYQQLTKITTKSISLAQAPTTITKASPLIPMEIMSAPSIAIQALKDSQRVLELQKHPMTSEGKETLQAQEPMKIKAWVQVSLKNMDRLNLVNTLKKDLIPKRILEVDQERKSDRAIAHSTNRTKLICPSVKSIPNKVDKRQDLDIMILVLTLVSLVKKEKEITRSIVWFN